MAGGTCLITGGFSGIGRAAALLLSRAGYRVAAVGLAAEAEAGAALADEIGRGGGRAAALLADVSAAADVARAFAEAEEALGPVSALVNAAGRQHSGRVDAFDPADILHLMAVNVVGTMLCCGQAVRRMSTRHGGRGGAIVNVSSMAATIGGRAGASAYAASKGAVDVFTTGLAKEVAGEGIRVNAVRPGATATAMTAPIAADPALRGRVEASIPLGRLARPEEIAAPIAWLLSDGASFVTGAHVDASGGGFIVTGAS